MVVNNSYPLVMTNIAMENDPFSMMIFPAN